MVTVVHPCFNARFLSNIIIFRLPILTWIFVFKAIHSLSPKKITVYTRTRITRQVQPVAGILRVATGSSSGAEDENDLI